MKVALINCYFGTLPNYFDLWLQSCSANPEVDFILITDANISYIGATNVKLINVSWNELINQINNKFDFDVSIKSPYKLTDFKPAYGYIFKDLVEPYDYWGYCDIDLIFGNLMKYIKEPMDQGYEKIYRLGHLTIYKNIEKMRNLFREKGAPFSYIEVFSNPEFYSFDEHAGQMSIVKKQGVKEYYKEDMADISCRVSRITASRHINYNHQVFYYDDGAVFRSYVKNGTVETEEFAYIHIQKRKYNIYNGKRNSFYILSDSFLEKRDKAPDIEEIIKLSEFESTAQERRQLHTFRKKKVRAFINCSLKEKYILIRIKHAERKF